jgi:hypothetical protein
MFVVSKSECTAGSLHGAVPRVAMDHKGRRRLRAIEQAPISLVCLMERILGVVLMPHCLSARVHSNAVGTQGSWGTHRQRGAPWLLKQRAACGAPRVSPS